jgi:hypothetical protein
MCSVSLFVVWGGVRNADGGRPQKQAAYNAVSF